MSGDEKMWHPPQFDLSEEIKGVGRRLDIHAEDSRTRLDLLTEKVVTGLTNILNHVEDIAVRLDRLERVRVEDRKQIEELERRVAAIEALPTARSRKKVK